MTSLEHYECKRNETAAAAQSNARAVAVEVAPLGAVLSRTRVHALVAMLNDHTSLNPFPAKRINSAPDSPSGVDNVAPLLLGGFTSPAGEISRHVPPARSNVNRSSKSPRTPLYPPNTYRFPRSAHALAPDRAVGAVPVAGTSEGALRLEVEQSPAFLPVSAEGFA